MKVDLENDVIIVTPNDALEALRYHQFHLEVGRINDLLRHHDYRHLVVDLSESPMIDSILLTALTGFCRAASGTAAFCSVPVDIRRSRRTMSLLSRWPMYATRSEAVEAMSLLNRR